MGKAAADTSASSTQAAALRLLARREHAVAELQRKLEAKGYERKTVNTILARLQEQGLLSNERFAESFVNAKRAKGFGPIRIRQELRFHSIDEEIINKFLDMAGPSWLTLANEVCRKRFGMDPSLNIEEKAKRMRFLLYRGFTEEQARSAVKQAE